MRFSTAFLLSLLGLLPISHAAPTPRAEDEGEFAPSSSKKLATFADAFSGNFSVLRATLQWISAGNSSDGTYVVQDPSTSSLTLGNIITNASSMFVDAAELNLDYYDYFIQPSAKHVLYSANYTKQYRYSYLADYYVWSVEEKTLVPLVEGQNGDVQYAAWSPQGDVIAYVRGNDLFIWKGGVSTRVTKDGGGNVFNGVPDWVYEAGLYPPPQNFSGKVE